MKLIIEDEEGRKTVIPLVQEEMELTIGRQDDNAIRLTERNVSRKHARLIRKKGTVLLEDLNSFCGVKVNRKRIETMVRVSDGDVIQIGDYDLTLEMEAGDANAMPPAVPASAAQPSSPAGGPPVVGAPVLLSGAPPQRLSTSIINIEDTSAYDEIQSFDIPLEQAPRLVIQSGDMKGQEFAFIRTVLTLGRDFDNDIAINHMSLSRRHCKFVRTQSGEWKIVDQNSSNGFSVNGESYKVATLSSGDTILVGKVKMCFFLPGAKRGVLKTIPTAAYVGGGIGMVAIIALLLVLILGRPAPQPQAVASAQVPATAGAENAGSAQAAAAPAPSGASDSGTSAQAAASAPSGEEKATDGTEEGAEGDSAPVGEGAGAAGEAAKAASAVAEENSADGSSKSGNQAAAVATAPEDAEGRKAVEHGRQLMEQGKFSDAMTEFSKAMERNVPGADKLLAEAASEMDAADGLKVAMDLYETGNFDEAEKRLADIPKSSSFAGEADDLQKKIAKGRTDAQAKKEAQAKKSQEKKKEKKTRHPYGSAYQEIPADKLDELDGYLGEQCDKPDKAIALLKKLIKENPNYGDAYMFLGSCYVISGKEEMGKKQYQYFLNRWPKHPDAGMVRDSMGR